MNHIAKTGIIEYINTQTEANKNDVIFHFLLITQILAKQQFYKKKNNNDFCLHIKNKLFVS